MKLLVAGFIVGILFWLSIQNGVETITFTESQPLPEQEFEFVSNGEISQTGTVGYQQLRIEQTIPSAFVKGPCYQITEDRTLEYKGFGEECGQ